MFNPWKQAKQKKQAQQFAEAYISRMRDAGEWFTQAEAMSQDFAQATDSETDVSIIYYYAKSVYTFYNMIDANRTEFNTAMENNIITTLNEIVNGTKNISLTDILNQPIVVRYDSEHGALIMPECIRFHDLGNDKLCIGKLPAVA
jgi:hypothetical protein